MPQHAEAPLPHERHQEAFTLLCVFSTPQVTSVQQKKNAQGKVIGQTYTIVPVTAGTRATVVPGSVAVPMAGGTQILMVPPENAAAADAYNAAAAGKQKPMTVPTVAGESTVPVAGAMPDTAGSTIVAAQPTVNGAAGLQAATVPIPGGVASSSLATSSNGQPAIATSNAVSNNGQGAGSATASGDGRTVTAQTPNWGRH
jgi:hypothetical protein